MTLRSHAILRRELAGALFVMLAGSTLHFVFGWSGGWRPLALIAAVNESVWEHLKLAFWPGLFWALLPWKTLETRTADRLAARGLSLLLTAALIVAVFESYTAILGRNLLPLDIGTFFLAVLVGQLAAAALDMNGPPGPVLRRLGLALLALQLLAYALFTFFPPDLGLFTDSRNGLQGIPPM